MKNFRIERDTLGEVQVPMDALWGAQTQRSINNFKIGSEKMPKPLITAYLNLKKACAKANEQLNNLDKEKSLAIQEACDELLSQENIMNHFPLVVWQTGSGTQSNMNVNEVIAHLVNEKEKVSVHPNDDVNKSQSSNDTFPTAMHIAAYLSIQNDLLPAMNKIIQSLDQKSEQFQTVVKIGRTHLQDATPLTVGQEFSGWSYMMKRTKEMLEMNIPFLLSLAIGGTSVGTGINAPQHFGEEVVKQLNGILQTNFVSSSNKFHGLTSHDELVTVHGVIQSLAMDLTKIANDIRLLASGPRSGIGELILPTNEPGSSIMPGKVNPTQCEALTMVAAQVFGNHSTISFCSSQGHLQLNVYKPVIIYNFLQSVQLLSDAMHSFVTNCIDGIELNTTRINEWMEQSLMLVTALNPVIGYENSAKLAKYAHEKNISLYEANQQLQLVDERTLKEVIKRSKSF